ncbi:DNA cytosine methyltransferase [Halomarina rubra]|uniref:DNA (cytosine-5-)-methyltransferase n=1 Tax=Halomarina rubra TaxID=2071873 RepID=A0ABD6AW09_9EURY
MTNRVSAVDLFCGAGGLTCGLESAGISVEAGVDYEEACEYPYETNNDAEFHQYDLKEVARESPEVIDELFDDDAEYKLLAGCPPCQPFSPLTHGEDSSDHESYPLLDAFKDLVRHIEPDYVVMENVHEVYHAEIYQSFEQDMVDWGYQLNFPQNRSVYCPKFDIPQTRRRWVTLAAREVIPDLIPSHRSPRKRKHLTVERTIDHLPEIQAGQTHPDDQLHTARELSETNLRRIRKSKPGGTWRDWPDRLVLDCHREDTGKSYDAVYGRMEPDEPAPTITTQFYNLGSGRFGHYDESQYRAISLREGALIQTFPEDYRFFEDIDDVGIRKSGVLIGNAVPPKLGEAIGERILCLIDGAEHQSMLADF